MRLKPLAALSFSMLLTGCSLTPTALLKSVTGVTLTGNVHGGQQPIAGAHIYLFAAGTAGYGSASTSLLSSGDATDLIGTYVLSDSNGNFHIGGDYNCTPNTQVYLYALGGDPGAGLNSAAGLIAALGNCPAAGNFAANVPFIWVNEVSTVAAAYAFSAFAVDATHVGSSGSTLAQTGIANAFANATNIADIASGVALASTPAGNGTVPQSTINTLANILAECVNSTGPASIPCTALFTNAMSAGSSGTQAADTATAAINIAHNPAANVAALFAIPTPAAAFAPALFTQPNDFTLAINFSGGGIASASHLAIDSTGSVWSSNLSTLTKLSTLGAAVSPSSGFIDSSLNGPAGLAIDFNDNVWAADSNAHSLTEFSTAGLFMNIASAPLNSLYFPHAAAIDPSGNIWVPTYNGLTNNVVKFASDGTYSATVLSGLLNQPQSLVIDPFGNLWVASIDSTVLKINNFGIPNILPYTGGGISSPLSITLDASGNIWTLNSNSSLGAITNTGAAVSGAPFDTGSSNSAQAVAVDGLGTKWLLSGSYSGFPPTLNSRLYAVTSSGVSIFTSGLAPLSSAADLAIDGSGDIWIAAGNSVAEIIGIAAPVTTPVASAVKNNTIATRP